MSAIGTLDSSLSIEAQQARRDAADRQAGRKGRLEQGPYLSRHVGTGELHVWIPSPRREPAFVAELRHWGFDYYYTDGLVVWHRPVTPGKECAALEWARARYLHHFGSNLPPIEEVS